MSYVRLARLREVLNSVQVLRGIPAGMGSRKTRPDRFCRHRLDWAKGAALPHLVRFGIWKG